jgi:DNA-binding transcriptional regulator YdaS (Cro superfamily)
MNTPIQKACDLLGGQSALARAIGVKPQSVQAWVARGEVPLKRCRSIENITGGKVTAAELRPEFF